MQLSQLDAVELFSLTLWKSESGYCAGVQKQAGDMVRYETRKTVSEAITAALQLVAPVTPPPPY